jgi:hypothetical protein
LQVVSLLGRKRDGFSEFSYYPFQSSQEPGGKPSFQQWLHINSPRALTVHEFPTTDARGIPQELLGSIKNCVRDLIKQHKIVVVMDSAGAERSARVCEAVGFRP